MNALLGYMVVFGMWTVVAAFIGVHVGYYQHSLEFERHAAQAMSLANGRNSNE